ncbi:hypothetical protein KC343_g23010 [Hortaea werneckii]|nr:hypothetical protein KC343_g23010 [Hortaea werneckii]
MSLYSPDDGAIPRDTDFVRALSQRDLGLQIPVNYVTYSGHKLVFAIWPAFDSQPWHSGRPRYYLFSNGPKTARLSHIHGYAIAFHCCD